MVIRNDAGLIMASLTQQIPLPTLVIEVEALATRRALEFGVCVLCSWICVLVFVFLSSVFWVCVLCSWIYVLVVFVLVILGSGFFFLNFLGM